MHLSQPLHHDPSAFCRAISGGKCAQAGIERDRSGLVENSVPFDIRKFRKFKPELRALGVWYHMHESELENGMHNADNARTHASYVLCSSTRSV